MEDNKKFELNDEMLDNVAGGNDYWEYLARLYSDWKQGDKVRLKADRKCSCGAYNSTATLRRFKISKHHLAINIKWDCCGASTHGEGELEKFEKIW